MEPAHEAGASWEDRGEYNPQGTETGPGDPEGATLQTQRSRGKLGVVEDGQASGVQHGFSSACLSSLSPSR